MHGSRSAARDGAGRSAVRAAAAALVLALLVALAAAPPADARKKRGCKKRGCRGSLVHRAKVSGLPAGWASAGVLPGPRPVGPVTPGAPSAPTTPTPPPGVPDDPPPPPPPPPPPSSARFLQVTADDTDLEDMHLYLSRGTVLAGEVTIEFNNRFAQDPHNLRLRRGGASFGFATVEKGEAAEDTFTLTAGTYTVFCSLAGHEVAGMKTQLAVE